MKDDRLYAKFTLDFPDHPKILCLSTEAKWALVDLTIYSRRHMTDGFINRSVALAKHGASVCQELATNDAENPSLMEVDDGYQIHDFALHQSTKAEIEQLTEKRKAAGRIGGLARAKASAKQTPKQNPSKSNPETETDIKNRFDEFWNIYPRKVGRKAASPAYSRAIRTIPEEELIAAAKAYADACKGSDEKFIAHPTTWLNQGRWDEFTARPTRTPEEFLNDCWDQATVTPITELTGRKPDFIRWPDPIPDDFDQPTYVRDFNRRWIKENRDELVQALRGRL